MPGRKTFVDERRGQPRFFEYAACKSADFPGHGGFVAMRIKRHAKDQQAGTFGINTTADGGHSVGNFNAVDGGQAANQGARWVGRRKSDTAPAVINGEQLHPFVGPIP